MKIHTKYNIEDIVYLVTDTEQLERIITSITIYPNNLIMYSLNCGVETSEHYEFEITHEIDNIKRLN